ncbi:MAG: DEAD/DEAH box helicase [Patescibacteria group bacterium]
MIKISSELLIEEEAENLAEKIATINGGVDLTKDEDLEAYANKYQERLKQIIESQPLPIKEKFGELVNRLSNAFKLDKAFLLQGETGSGKSVYSPLAILEALKILNLPEKVVVMQPRRDACRNVARAIAALTDSNLGGEVGFSTSEEKKFNDQTKIRVVTPGIFNQYLANGELTKDKVGAVLIDEMHEASSEYHLAIGLLKLLQQAHHAPQIMLTSATINKEQILNFFQIDSHEYLNVSGRSFPVNRHYSEQVNYEKDTDYFFEINNIAKKICSSGESGDILVFLPGLYEINEMADDLSKLPEVEVLKLHSTLSPAERDNVIMGKNGKKGPRRIILSTNIAETSVTVPGIKFVIDSGRQRSVSYNPNLGINDFVTEYISKDQVAQRAGRAGRLEPGEYFSVLSEDDYDQLAEHPKAAIHKENLAHFVLVLKSMGISPEEFPFIDPPAKDKLKAAEDELQILGVFDEQGKISAIGKEMMELSLSFEPRMARMIIEARKLGCLNETLIMAAFDRERSLFTLPSQEDEKKYGSRKMANVHYQEMRAKFNSGGSDYFRSLNVFKEALEKGLLEAHHWDKSQEGQAIYEDFISWCDDYRISAKALKRIAFDVKKYLKYLGQNEPNLENILKTKPRLFDESVKTLDLDENSLSKVLLSGFPDRLMHQVSFRPPTFASLGNKELDRIFISPGSAAFSSSGLDFSLGSITYNERSEKNYAANIHPLNIKALYEARPELFADRKPPRLLFDPRTGGVSQIKFLSLKDKPEIIAGEIELPTNGPEAEEIIKHFPRQIKLDSVECQVHYFFEIFGSEELTAKVIVPPGNIFGIKEFSLPELGTKDQKVSVRFASSEDSPAIFFSLDSLKYKVEEDLLHEKWKKWDNENNKGKNIFINNEDSLPEVEQLGFKPKVYAMDQQGNEHYAYPAVVLAGLDLLQPKQNLKVTYFQTEEQAQSAQSRALAQWQEFGFNLGRIKKSKELATKYKSSFDLVRDINEKLEKMEMKETSDLGQEAKYLEQELLNDTMRNSEKSIESTTVLLKRLKHAIEVKENDNKLKGKYAAEWQDILGQYQKMQAEHSSVPFYNSQWRKLIEKIDLVVSGDYDFEQSLKKAIELEAESAKPELIQFLPAEFISGFKGRKEALEKMLAEVKAFRTGPKKEKPKAKELTPEQMEQELKEEMEFYDIILQEQLRDKNYLTAGINLEKRQKNLGILKDQRKELNSIRNDLGKITLNSSKSKFGAIRRSIDKAVSELAKQTNYNPKWPAVYTAITDEYVPQLEEFLGQKFEASDLKRNFEKLVAVAKNPYLSANDIKKQVEDILTS